ncbi:hypothetical protein D3C81_1991660 [compost metagenome]
MSTVLAAITSTFQRPSNARMPSRISWSLSTHSTRMPASESSPPNADAGFSADCGTLGAATRGRVMENMLPWPIWLRAFKP